MILAATPLSQLKRHGSHVLASYAKVVDFYKIALPSARDRQENGLYDIQTADQLRPDMEPHATVWKNVR